MLHRSNGGKNARQNSSKRNKKWTILKKHLQPGLVVNALNTSTRETETGRSL